MTHGTKIFEVFFAPVFPVRSAITAIHTQCGENLPQMALSSAKRHFPTCLTGRQSRPFDRVHFSGQVFDVYYFFTVTHLNQVWVSDITYIALGSGFAYLIITDVFTRAIRGWFLSRRLGSDLTLLAIKRALEQGTPVIHHSACTPAKRSKANTTRQGSVLVYYKAIQLLSRWQRWGAPKRTAMR